MAPSPQESSTAPTAPGVVTGHAKLALGKAQETFGYTEQGKANVEAGTEELKEYSAQNPASANGGTTLGNVEAKIGSAVGCEGLEEGGTKTV